MDFSQLAKLIDNLFGIRGVVDLKVGQQLLDTLRASWWVGRTKDNKRLYAFLLYGDEHKSFREAIFQSWETIEAVSGDHCEIWLVDTRKSILGPSKGKMSRAAAAIAVRDRLFAGARGVAMPGFVVFPSTFEGKARYYGCQGMTAEQISAEFQIVMDSIRRAGDRATDRSTLWQTFEDIEQLRSLKSQSMDLLKKISPSDLIALGARLFGGS